MRKPRHQQVEKHILMFRGHKNLNQAKKNMIENIFLELTRLLSQREISLSYFSMTCARLYELQDQQTIVSENLLLIAAELDWEVTNYIMDHHQFSLKEVKRIVAQIQNYYKQKTDTKISLKWIINGLEVK